MSADREPTPEVRAGNPAEPAGKGLLEGVRVLDLSTVGPATRCSRLLADYGASVVKVGAPGRPVTLAFHAYGGQRGTLRVAIDVRSPAGREAFLRLASRADVVLESFRPGVVDRLGIGYEAVRAVNPGIVYCSTSGYGQTGPHARRAGHDLNYLAVGGLLHTSGRGSDRAPALPGATVADIAAGGMHAAAAILAALFRRERRRQNPQLRAQAQGEVEVEVNVGAEVEVEGSYLDVAVADGVAWMLSLYIDEYLATGEAPGPGHNILTGRYACYGVYGTRDGGWLAVAAIEPVFWVNLCRALGLERFVEHQTDDAQQDAIRADLAAVLATRDRDEWVADLADADTCVAPVQDIAEVVTDPQLVARGAVVEAKHPAHGVIRQLGPVLAGSAPLPGVVELPDVESTDTDDLLTEAGYSEDELAALRADGVIA